MPRGDRTGPTGMGPMTGRGAGYCAGYSVPGFANPVYGGVRAYGGGYGGGHGGGYGGGGYRHRYFAYGYPAGRPGRFFDPYGGGWYGAPCTPLPSSPYNPAYGTSYGTNPPGAEVSEKEILEQEINLAEGHLTNLKKRMEEISGMQEEDQT